jgi:hypothetical protein
LKTQALSTSPDGIDILFLPRFNRKIPKNRKFIPSGNGRPGEARKRSAFPRPLVRVQQEGVPHEMPKASARPAIA